MKPKKHALLIGIDRYLHLGKQYFLKGCKRDVELLGRLLIDRFEFPEPKTLLDDQATRSRILLEMQDLLDTVKEKDLVFFYFSGHGSQRAPPLIESPDLKTSDMGYAETIVPYDSGRPRERNSPPNRDIYDKDIRNWLRILAQRAAHVTLVFDCCHSGGILRNRHSARVRQVPTDQRPIQHQAVPWANPNPEFPRPITENQYTLFAACRPRELAFELPLEHHGALTFFLARALVRASGGVTWCDLFEELCPQVTAHFPRQHPLREGQLEREPFGTRLFRTMPFWRVSGRRGNFVEIETGTVHGAKMGSRYLIHPPGTRTCQGCESLGLAELDRVGSLTSSGRFLSDGLDPSMPLKGCRAVLESHHPGQWKTSVGLAASLVDHPLGHTLTRWLELSPWLDSTPAETSQIHLNLLTPRNICEPEDPLPQLGPLDRAILAACGEDGDLALPLISADEERAVAVLVSHLETLARYRNILEIENPEPEGEFTPQIRLELKKLTGDTWVTVESSSAESITCRAGDRFGIKITNQSTRKIFPYILDLGLTGKVNLLYPVSGAYEPLLPGRGLEIGMDPDDIPIELQLPANLPFDSILGHTRREPRRRTEHIKVFATSRTTDFSVLSQEGYRTPEPEGPAQTLEELLWRAWTGTDRLIRCRPTSSEDSDEEWTTLCRCFEVEY